MNIMEDKSLLIPPDRTSGTKGLSRKGGMSTMKPITSIAPTFSAVPLYGYSASISTKIDENVGAMLE